MLTIERTVFRGAVHRPGDPGYDAQRAPWRPTIDPRPVMVVEAAGADDVRAAVLTAQRQEMPFAVQATGHGTFVPSDGGLLLKTSRMASVVVDPGRRVAWAGPGARWSEVIAAAAPYGLAPLSGSAPSVGVAGYTLGGGFGWLSRKYGFAADSLLSADLVTADGRLLTADADHNADLFWAVRGGGGNFGVVTSLEFRLYPVPEVYAGTAFFPVGNAVDTLVRFRDLAERLPDELMASVVLTKDSLAIRGVYAGSAEDGVRAMRPLWEAAGTPVRDGFRPMPYADTGSVGGTAPRQFKLFAELPDAVIEAIAGPVIDQAAAVELRLWGGALAHPGADAGPAGHRDVPFTVGIDGPAAAAAPIDPYATGGSFLNFLGDPARTHTAFTAANYARLREIKRAYDPGNVFRVNHNIA